MYRPATLTELAAEAQPSAPAVDVAALKAQMAEAASTIAAAECAPGYDSLFPGPDVQAARGRYSRAKALLAHAGVPA